MGGTAVKLSDAFLGFLLFPALCFAAGNPIPNSSFELGRADFSVNRAVGLDKPAVFREVFFDTEDKIHGNQSLRIDNPDMDVLELVSREYKLVPGKVYTFSWWMKSSRPLTIRAGQFAGEMTTPTKADWGMFRAEQFACGPEWKRYSFRFTAKGKRSWYFTHFRWGKLKESDPGSDATIWFDALQVSEGAEVAAYTPKSPVEAAVFGDSRVFSSGKSAAELRLVNHTDVPQKVAVKWSAEDTLLPGRKLPEQVLSLTLKSGEQRIEKLGIPVRKNGHWRLSGKVEGEDFFANLEPWHFAVVPEPPPRDSVNAPGFKMGTNTAFMRGMWGIQDFLPGSFYAMNGGGREEYIAFIKRAGVFIERIYGSRFCWKQVMPEPGKFDTAIVDDALDIARKHQFKLMPVLGDMFYLRDWAGEKRVRTTVPDWIMKSPATRIHAMSGVWDGISPDPEAWKTYVDFLSRYCRGNIYGWEITNEPNIALPGAKVYIPYLFSASEIIHKNDPAAKVIGGSITTDYGGQVEAFLDEMGRSGALKASDALSFHPYASALDDSRQSAVSALTNLRKQVDRYVPGLPLWNSELYYIGPAASAHYAVASRSTHAQHVFRRYVIDCGEGVEVSVPIYDTMFLQNELAPHWELGDFWGYAGLVPHDIYAGYASASALLTNAVSLGAVPWPTGATGYLFRLRDGREAAVFWKVPAMEPCSLTLPKGNYELLDMYLNPMEKPSDGKLVLTEFPVVLRAGNAAALMKRATLNVARSMKISRTWQVPENGGIFHCIEVVNLAPEKITAIVRPDYLSAAQCAEIPLNGKHVFRFESGEKAVEGKTVLYYSDETHNFSVPLPPFARKLMRSGTAARGALYSFRTEMTPDALRIQISVSDNDRGPRPENAPWDGDSAELFFDSDPQSSFSVPNAGKSVSRLILAPRSSNGLPVLVQGLGMDAARCRAEILEERNGGWRAEVLIPWSVLSMNGAGILGFDLKINSSSARSTAKKAEIWSGTDQNFRRRDRYGILLPAN